MSSDMDWTWGAITIACLSFQGFQGRTSEGHFFKMTWYTPPFGLGCLQGLSEWYVVTVSPLFGLIWAVCVSLSRQWPETCHGYTLMRFATLGYKSSLVLSRLLLPSRNLVSQLQCRLEREIISFLRKWNPPLCPSISSIKEEKTRSSLYKHCHVVRYVTPGYLMLLKSLSAGLLLVLTNHFFPITNCYDYENYENCLYMALHVRDPNECV